MYFLGNHSEANYFAAFGLSVSLLNIEGTALTFGIASGLETLSS